MPEQLRSFVRIVALVCLAIVTPSWATGDAIRVAGEPRPAVLDLVDTSVPPIALAVGPDGRNAAASYLDPAKPNRSIVRIYSTYRDEQLEVGLAAIARSLLFSPDGLEVYVVQYRPAKKRLGEAQLMRINVADGKARDIMPLPATSSALDYCPARASLLVAAMNEIRTVRVTGMRSGPLFRIPGANLAVTALGGSSVVLVGQGRELLLVNLDDHSDEDGMPVRERVPVPSPVASLAALPDGSGALALLSDGTVRQVSFEPLATESAGSALAVVALSKVETSATIALAPLPVPEVEQDEDEPMATAQVEPDVPPVGETPVPVLVTPEPPAPAKAQPGETATQVPPPSAPAEPTATTAAPAWREDEAPQLWGRLSGEAMSEVREVILLGPNSIVREARRVRPEDGGLWKADDLEPGRYQIQLSAGGRKVLVTEPRIAMVDVGEAGSIEAMEFRVLRAFVP